MYNNTDTSISTVSINNTTATNTKKTLRIAGLTVKDFWNKKAWPSIQKFWTESFVPGISAFGHALWRGARLSWVAVLAFAILWLMSQNGLLDELPNIKWMVQASGNIIDWVFGLLRSFVSWLAHIDFWLPNEFETWFREMMAV